MTDLILIFSPWCVLLQILILKAMGPVLGLLLFLCLEMCELFGW